MAGRVTERTANWRLFGGGGMLAGGLLWLIALIAGAAGAGGPVTGWLTTIGLLLLGASGFFLAFGQTGSNGVVGGSVLGKLGFVAFGIGFLLLGLIRLLGAFGTELPSGTATVATVLIVIGGIIGAVVTYQKGVARGAARWFFAVPVVLSIVWLLSTAGLLVIAGNILPILVALAYTLAGLLFLLNRR
ncbi:hypothetical protein [Microcella sp.]|uniref:hypothetical protein n=1 Tax=Microcella sp. TaxID=1913979 RepID=UPI0039194D3A